MELNCKEQFLTFFTLWISRKEQFLKTLSTTIFLVLSLSGCGTESVTYFKCEDGSSNPISFVIDKKNQTFSYDDEETLPYEEINPSYIRSIEVLTKGTYKNITTTKFDLVTGELVQISEWGDDGTPYGITNRFRCKKVDTLI